MTSAGSGSAPGEAARPTALRRPQPPLRCLWANSAPTAKPVRHAQTWQDPRNWWLAQSRAATWKTQIDSKASTAIIANSCEPERSSRRDKTQGLATAGRTAPQPPATSSARGRGRRSGSRANSPRIPRTRSSPLHSPRRLTPSTRPQPRREGESATRGARRTGRRTASLGRFSGLGVEQNPGDEVAGKSEEDIHSDPAEAEQDRCGRQSRRSLRARAHHPALAHGMGPLSRPCRSERSPGIGLSLRSGGQALNCHCLFAPGGPPKPGDDTCADGVGAESVALLERLQDARRERAEDRPARPSPHRQVSRIPQARRNASRRAECRRPGTPPQPSRMSRVAWTTRRRSCIDASPRPRRADRSRRPR